MKKMFGIMPAIALCVACTGAAFSQNPAPSGEKSTVFMTKKISPEGLKAVYDALRFTPSGKVAVKLHTGEVGNRHYLSPALIKNLVQELNGTIVECNTAYGGSRANAAMHMRVAKDHGFTAIAPVDIMDAKGSLSLPVRNGKHLTNNLVGLNYTNYDTYLILSHFKGHAMGGFGGAVKNTSIGIASSAGKSLLHRGGKNIANMWAGDQNSFLESMAEAALAVAKDKAGRIIYINVMNHLSVDCDCSGAPAAPRMNDVGILASYDPVALDKACVDLVYAAPRNESAPLIRRIESRNGLLTLTYGAQIGLGNLGYNLVVVE